MGKMIEKDHSMITIIQLISEKEILEEHKFREVKILEEDIEVASGMIILEEVGVGPEKDSIQVPLGGTLEGMIEAVVYRF